MEGGISQQPATLQLFSSCFYYWQNKDYRDPPTLGDDFF